LKIIQSCYNILAKMLIKNRRN